MAECLQLVFFVSPVAAPIVMEIALYAKFAIMDTI